MCSDVFRCVNMYVRGFCDTRSKMSNNNTSEYSLVQSLSLEEDVIRCVILVADVDRCESCFNWRHILYFVRCSHMYVLL